MYSIRALENSKKREIVRLVAGIYRIYRNKPMQLMLIYQPTHKDLATHMKDCHTASI